MARRVQRELVAVRRSDQLVLQLEDRHLRWPVQRLAGVVDERRLHVLLRFGSLHRVSIPPVQRWLVVVRQHGQWVHPRGDYSAGTDLARVYGCWSGWTGWGGSKEAKVGVVRGGTLRDP